MKSRPGPFGDSLVQDLKRKRQIEAQARHSGQNLVDAAPQAEYVVKLTSHLGNDPATGQPSYEGDMQETPFLKFRQNPNAQADDEVGPILSTNNFVVLDATVTERFVNASPSTDAQGEQVWWFTYVESLPPGGADGTYLRRDANGVAYWDNLTITY